MAYTGDGVMALFGAPTALEDHAFRACLAALAIQEEATGLTAGVQRRDGVAPQLRVGLNSGRVIAGFGMGIATSDRLGLARHRAVVAGPSRMAPRPSRLRRAGQRSNPETLSGAVAWTYGFAMQYGTLRTSDSVVRVSEDAMQTAQKASSDRALGLAAYTVAVGLLNRDAAAERQRGLEFMMQARDIWLRKRALFLIPVTDLWAARETARRGDHDAAIAAMRQAVGELRQAENLFYGVWGTGLLLETLLERGAQGDLAEADEAIDGLAVLWVDDGSAIREIMLLRLRTLLARAHGDDAAYRDLLSRYRAMAKSLGFEGHIGWAEAMVEGGE